MGLTLHSNLISASVFIAQRQICIRTAVASLFADLSVLDLFPRLLTNNSVTDAEFRPGVDADAP
jgi:hypothetical protein